MTWIVVLIAAILLMVGGVAAFAMSARRGYRADNQIVAGTSTQAPPEWAGAHTPEALLHRRLRDAMRALHKHPRRDDASLLDLRVGLEQQALGVDERLMAVAALPVQVRAEPLAAVGVAVEAVENAVAALTTQMSAETPLLEQSTAELTERFHFIEQARAELDRLQPAPDPPAPTRDPLGKREDPTAAG